MRVFLEEIGGGVEALLGLGGLSDLSYFGRGDHGSFVAKGISDVGENGGELFIGELLEGRHGNLPGVIFSFHFDGAEKAVEGEFNEAIFGAVDPLGAGEWWEHGGGKAGAVSLVAGDAVALAGVNFVAFFEESEGVAFERRSGLCHFFAGFGLELLALELGFGGFEDGLEPFVDGVFFDLGKDGETFLRREPGGSDGGLEADARGFVCGKLLEHIGGVFDLIAV